MSPPNPTPETVPPPVLPEDVYRRGLDDLVKAVEKAYRTGYREGWQAGWRAGLAQYVRPKKVKRARKRKAGTAAPEKAS